MISILFHQIRNAVLTDHMNMSAGSVKQRSDQGKRLPADIEPVSVLFRFKTPENDIVPAQRFRKRSGEYPLRYTYRYP